MIDMMFIFLISIFVKNKPATRPDSPLAAAPPL